MSSERETMVAHLAILIHYHVSMKMIRFRSDTAIINMQLPVIISLHDSIFKIGGWDIRSFKDLSSLFAVNLSTRIRLALSTSICLLSTSLF